MGVYTRAQLGESFPCTDLKFKFINNWFAGDCACIATNVVFCLMGRVWLVSLGNDYGTIL